MKILGIETSCDETAAAVVENGTQILSNVVASSSQRHAKTGGIIPEVAARQQIKSIIPVIEQALVKAFEVENGKLEAGFSHLPLLTSRIDALAVTVGPGLIGSLLVGTETAKTLAYLWKKPIVGVNHLAAHIYANFISENPKSEIRNTEQGSRLRRKQTQNSKFKNQNSKLPEFPALALVVSGGHTDLVLMKGHGKLKWIGGTRDDAAGEAFDKCARLLGLPYPGGPAISAEAEKFFNSSRFTDHRSLTMFPRPMIGESNFDWSFSGLKTSVLRQLNGKTPSKSSVPMLAVEIQEAIVDVLVEKTLRALKKFKPRSLLLAGGVAANNRLAEKFQKKISKELHEKVSFHVPPPHLCTDNATYIAAYAHFNFNPVDLKKISANPQLTITGEI